MKRPYLDEFLNELRNFYEIVIFTSGIQEYADSVVDVIDKNKCVSHRLYRVHTIYEDYSFVKNLENLGRDLSKVIIIDNNY